MVYEKKQLLLAFVLAVLAGAGLHFVYGLCPNGVTALFSPVNESIWEHTKILFWPYLAAHLGEAHRPAPLDADGSGNLPGHVGGGIPAPCGAGLEQPCGRPGAVRRADGSGLLAAHPHGRTVPGPAVAFACSVGGAAGGGYGVLYLPSASGSSVYRFFPGERAANEVERRSTST